MRALLIGLAVGVALTGCMMGPNYKRPEVETPNTYRVELPPVNDLINTTWWQQFNDPVLNELIKTALAENKDVRIAAARIEEFLGRYLEKIAEAYSRTVDGKVLLRFPRLFFVAVR